jgi:chromosome segregation ATPase
MDTLKKVFRFDEDKIVLFSIIGPISLILTLLVSSIAIGMNYDLWFFVFTGIFLCSRYKKNGFLAVFTSFLIYSSIKHFFAQNHLWQAGLEISFVIGFFTTYFCFEYIDNFLHLQNKDRKDLIKNINELEEDFKREKEVVQSSLFVTSQTLDSERDKLTRQTQLALSYKNLILSMQDDQKQKKDDKEQIIKENIDCQKKINHLEQNLKNATDFIDKLKDEKALIDKNKILLDELNEVRKEKQQTHFINEAMANILDKEIKKRERKVISSQQSLEMIELKYQSLEKKLYENQKLIDDLKKSNSIKDEKIKDLSKKSSQETFVKPAIVDKKEKIQKPQTNINHFESLYKQLQRQFNERKLVLHKTRKELFYANEKINAMNQSSELDRFDMSHVEKKYLKELVKIGEEYKRLEEENKSLHDLVTSLMD